MNNFHSWEREVGPEGVLIVSLAGKHGKGGELHHALFVFIDLSFGIN